MTKILLFVFLILLISSGLGLLVKKTLNLKMESFYAPLGLISYFALLQTIFYPLQFFKVSSFWLMALFSVVSLVLLVYAIINIKEIIKNYLNINTIFVLISFIGFLFLFYNLSIAMEMSDSQVYLNYIAQNINIDHLGQFSFTNGLLHDSPDVFYLYQSYYYFASFMCWVVNVPYNIFHITGFVENITISVWGLGMIYSLFSSMVFVNIVNHFKIKNKIFKYSILLFLMFFYNLYYWRVAFAFYGNTYRTIIIGALIFYLYRKYQEKEEISPWIFAIIISAGLATSSSSLFITFDVVYLLMTYLVHKKSEDIVYNLSIIILPIVIFLVFFGSSYSTIASIILLIAACNYYYFLVRGKLKHELRKMDKYFNKYGNYFFLIVIPILFTIYSIYIWNSNPGYTINFGHYFSNFAKEDMTVDPFGLYANPLERILTILKWLSVAVIIYRSFKKDNNFLGFIFAFAMIIFLNPFTITAISVLYTYNVYYRAFDIILNPFTITVFALTIQSLVKNKKVITSLLIGTSIISIILMNLYLFTPINTFTSYRYYLDNGKEVDHLTKLYDEEYLVLQQIRGYELIPDDKQITVISQLEGLKTVFPNVYQFYARAQYFYGEKRYDEQFWLMARRQYGWLSRPEVDYSKACDYIYEYNIDMAIINTFESFEFDQSTDACMTTVIKTDNYHVKTTNPK